MSFNNHLKSEGIYVVNPHTQKKNTAKPNQVLSVEGLKKALRYVDQIVCPSMFLFIFSWLLKIFFGCIVVFFVKLGCIVAIFMQTANQFSS